MVKDQWTADDLAQETFIRVRENLNDLRDHSKLKSWIYQIARNQCLDYFRSSGQKYDALEINDNVLGIGEPDIQLKLEQNQMSNCVLNKIDLLPEPLREVLILFESEELNNQQISEILNISVANVKVRLHRARKALKEILERECNFEHDERNVMICLPAEITNGEK
jgi:RNA polymerase sigma-70 factor (ECF subfamily)